MDDAQRDEILWRLDERTELIQTDVQEVKEKTAEQDEAIHKTRTLARDNRKILNTMTFGLTTLVTAIMGKLAGIIKI